MYRQVIISNCVAAIELHFSVRSPVAAHIFCCAHKKHRQKRSNKQMKAKRFLSVILSIVMAVSVMTVFAVNASAEESIEKTAKSISSGKWVTKMMTVNNDPIDYKIKVSEDGILKINYSFERSRTTLYVYDSNGNTVKNSNVTTTAGKKYETSDHLRLELEWANTLKKATGTVKYNVSKGTYYIRLKKYYTDDGKVSIKATFPSASSSSDIKITSFTLEMKKGDTLQLGTLLSADTDDNVTWKSSKTSIAKVSATGKITAKAKGSAVITASIGSSTMKIQVNVS